MSTENEANSTTAPEQGPASGAEPPYFKNPKLEQGRSLFKKLLRKYVVFLLKLSPHQNLTYTVFFYTIIGFILLSLPFMDHGVCAIDNLFTAASAISTTGLNSVSFAESYTFLGKFIVLLLIQIGGIGYMTMSSFIHLSFSHRIAHRHKEVLDVAFSIPKKMRMQEFLYAVIIFTVIVEGIGAILLTNYFYRQDMGFWTALWHGIFHSVSAFCTAGFSLMNNSLVSYEDSKTINVIISTLAILGAVGFIVVTDIFNRIIRRTDQISYTTKIIVLSILFLLLFGTVFIFLTNPIESGSLRAAFFHAMSAITTSGFHTIPLQTLSLSSLLIMMLLMSVGAAPGGTGGGVKTTAATAVLAIVYNRLISKEAVTFLGRKIPLPRLYLATATFIFYAMVLFTSIFFLTWTESLNFVQLCFESVSALSTAGISTFSPNLSTLGKLNIIITMLIGRVGVITFGMSLIGKDEDEKPEPYAKREDLAI